MSHLHRLGTQWIITLHSLIVNVYSAHTKYQPTLTYVYLMCVVHIPNVSPLTHLEIFYSYHRDIHAFLVEVCSLVTDRCMCVLCYSLQLFMRSLELIRRANVLTEVGHMISVQSDCSIVLVLKICIKWLQHSSLSLQDGYHNVFGYMEGIYHAHSEFWTWTLQPCLDQVRVQTSHHFLWLTCLACTSFLYLCLYVLQLDDIRVRYVPLGLWDGEPPGH